MTCTAFPEICICAAVRTPAGKIIRCHRHSDGILIANAGGNVGRITQDNQGFITSRNRYVSREEGAELQKAAGIRSIRFHEAGDYPSMLTSEDLY